MDPNKTYELFVKRFITLVTVVVLVGGAVSFSLYKADIPYTENDLLRQYQMHKLETASNIDTIIVGDSSAGNAIAADLFSERTGTHAVSLALTGSFGIEGSYNMVRQAFRLGQPIKYVVIVQTLDVWRRPFSEQGILDTQEGLPACEFSEICSRPFAMSKYLFNPKELSWALDFLIKGPPQFVIENDYRKQNDTPHVETTLVAGTVSQISSFIDPSKQKSFMMFDRLCKERGLICVYMHGPLRESEALRSKPAIAAINTLLDSATTIHVSHDLFMLPEEKVGDSSDHVSSKFKPETTTWYAVHFMDLIRSESLPES